MASFAQPWEEGLELQKTLPPMSKRLPARTGKQTPGPLGSWVRTPGEGVWVTPCKREEVQLPPPLETLAQSAGKTPSGVSPGVKRHFFWMFKNGTPGYLTVSWPHKGMKNLPKEAPGTQSMTAPP